MNELSIATEAKAQNMVHVIHLTAVLMAPDHIALQLPRFEIDFRQYLGQRRNPQHLNSIFI